MYSKPVIRQEGLRSAVVKCLREMYFFQNSCFFSIPGGSRRALHSDWLTIGDYFAWQQHGNVHIARADTSWIIVMCETSVCGLPGKATAKRTRIWLQYDAAVTFRSKVNGVLNSVIKGFRTVWRRWLGTEIDKHELSFSLTSILLEKPSYEDKLVAMSGTSSEKK